MNRALFFLFVFMPFIFPAIVVGYIAKAIKSGAALGDKLFDSHADSLIEKPRR